MRFSKRLCVLWSSVLMWGLALPSAQAVSPAPKDVRGTALFPYYEAPEFLHSQVKFHFQPLTESLGARLDVLSEQVRAYCQGSGRLEALREPLNDAYHDWGRLTTVVEGPVLEGSLVRVLDSQPFRLKNLQQALQAYDKNPEAFASFGGSAKGFPALFYLLEQRATPLSPSECQYASAVVDEARQLTQGLNWQTSTMSVQLHFNQTLGALQHLTWDLIEKPKLKKKDQGSNSTSGLDKTDSTRDLEASSLILRQWTVLRHLLSPRLLAQVPLPNRNNISLDVYLRGLGHIEQAQTLQDQVRLVDQNIQLQYMQKKGNPQQLMKSLKALIEVMERDVAPALNVSVMFSSSDGD
jgi:predicted lipoprotein